MADEDRIADILLRWEDGFEQGNDLPAEELCQDCPQLVGEVAERIAALKRTAWLMKLGQRPLEPLPSSAHQAGEVLAGRFRLDRQVGSGGFGEVWQGFDQQLQRTVAIKVPRPSRFPAPEQIEDFLAEARKVASLEHPGIVPIFDVGREGDFCFLVSQFVEGGSLADIPTLRKVIPADTARFVAQIAEALHYAHQQGFIHRDVKAANVLIDQHGRALLCDFGIAVASGTSTGPALGTLRCMSPEQLFGDDSRIDHRSDIYSLGVLLYELLTGNPPFSASDPSTVREKILHNEPLSPKSVNRTIPAELDRICLKCLAKSPANRYQSAQSLADDLRKALSRPSRRRFLALTGGCVLLLAGGLVAWSSREPADLSEDLTGTWTGTWHDHDGTSGDGVLMLTEQSGGTLTGWWDKDTAIEKGRRVNRDEVGWESTASGELRQARGKIRDRGRRLVLVYAAREMSNGKTDMSIGIERFTREGASLSSTPEREGWAGKWIGLYANSLGGIGGSDLTINEGEDNSLVCTWDDGSSMRGTIGEGGKARWEQVQSDYENRVYKAEVWLEGDVLRTKYTLTYPPGSKGKDFSGEEWFIRD